VNLQQVATEAGVSSAAVLYYFKTKDELIENALDAVLDEYYRNRVELVKDLYEPRTRLMTLIVAGFRPEARDDLRILLESVSRLHVDPRFQTKHLLIVERQLGLYQTTIEIGTAMQVFRPRPDSTTVARNLLALEDAYSLYPLVGMDLTSEQSIRNVVSYAELALDVDLADLLNSML